MNFIQCFECTCYVNYIENFRELKEKVYKSDCLVKNETHEFIKEIKRSFKSELKNFISQIPNFATDCYNRLLDDIENPLVKKFILIHQIKEKDLIKTL
ncbi:hypothetical protein A0H76_1249 [Hepatospora eriocheir]|uniref:Uncharacterized protein n=1 Tax=Hepatospora eriocheir TaxID=1081669 RepID=A0A1X0QHG2_9MICR|nr:hypothetical protein A0H76_1249 [Hepatospora eriocheir]